MHSKLVSKNVKISKNGEFITVDVYVNDRGGSKSPYSWYYVSNNRIISEYEMKIRGWNRPGMDLYFKAYYGPVGLEILKEQTSNPLVELFSRESSFVGSYITIPRLK